MKQSKLTDIDKPPAPYSCWTCKDALQIIMRDGFQLVQCNINKAFKPVVINCHVHNDGKDHWPEIPAGAEPDVKKWRNE